MSAQSTLAPQFTTTDLDAGSRLVDALVRHAGAKQGAVIGDHDLLALARRMHPKDAVLGRAVPVGIGMPLRFVELFCVASAYPNLACLAVNQASMQPGRAYERDWKADRQAAAGFDWSGVEDRLTAYVGARRAAVPKRFRPRKERTADVAWYAYLCARREACADLGAEDKKEIVNLPMAGLGPDTALHRVLAAKAVPGGAS